MLIHLSIYCYKPLLFKATFAFCKKITLIFGAKFPGTNKAYPAYAQAQTTNNGPGY